MLRDICSSLPDLEVTSASPRTQTLELGQGYESLEPLVRMVAERGAHMCSHDLAAPAWVHNRRGAQGAHHNEARAWNHDLRGMIVWMV